MFVLYLHAECDNERILHSDNKTNVHFLMRDLIEKLGGHSSAPCLFRFFVLFFLSFVRLSDIYIACLLMPIFSTLKLLVTGTFFSTRGILGITFETFHPLDNDIAGKLFVSARLSYKRQALVDGICGDRCHLGLEGRKGLDPVHDLLEVLNTVFKIFR